MTKILMPYGSADYANLVSKTAGGIDTGKLVELFEEHLKRTEKRGQGAPVPQSSTTKS
jgi:hypothetical protein